MDGTGPQWSAWSSAVRSNADADAGANANAGRGRKGWMAPCLACLQGLQSTTIDQESSLLVGPEADNPSLGLSSIVERLSGWGSSALVTAGFGITSGRVTRGVSDVLAASRGADSDRAVRLPCYISENQMNRHQGTVPF
ncbi:hypothetical protein JDV02_010876 [Purpureocillium takamizusanense]|uniref:Uncharacterized protein n=1 Tax=Purpureocillium takamizusanense TaxID=2060973 RepID=A0A9Q8QN85_9HYPO|nr:uncharacterized protein JDV02_010876 [Purpureocillium takamizusanense]UNI22710.1 hypothetical protein JDV02_010876 [Purpureocillium takamizusanense]